MSHDRPDIKTMVTKYETNRKDSFFRRYIQWLVVILIIIYKNIIIIIVYNIIKNIIITNDY